MISSILGRCILTQTYSPPPTTPTMNETDEQARRRFDDYIRTTFRMVIQVGEYQVITDRIVG